MCYIGKDLSSLNGTHHPKADSGTNRNYTLIYAIFSPPNNKLRLYLHKLQTFGIFNTFTEVYYPKNLISC